MPDEGAILYWRAAILLHHAEAEQSYKRVQEAHGLLHKAAAAAPGLDSGGPARLLARVYQETPGFPFLGSKPRALEWYGKSLQAAPDFIQTHLWLGETHLQMKQVDKARYSLDKAATLPLRKGHEVEDGAFRASAQALLKTLPN
jgi:tetratricopeptide (TPR) repeat protein